MSDYVIPAEATAEMIKQMIHDAEAKLGRLQAAVDAAQDEATRRELEREEHRTQSFLSRLECRNTLAETNSLKGTVETNRADIAVLKEASSRQDEKVGDLTVVVNEAVNRILSLEKFTVQIRNTVDAVDNRQRRQNAIVFGLPLQSLNTAVATVFKGAPDLERELDDVYFLTGADLTKKYPLKLQFKCCSAASDFISYAKRPPFSTSKATRTLSVGRDVSALRCVGTTRLMASTTRLKTAFPDLYITPSSSAVRINNVKYDALDFASMTVKIGDVEFDIEKACRENPDFEEAESLSIEQGEVSTCGFRRRRTGPQASSGGDEEMEQDGEEDGGEADGEPTAARDAGLGAGGFGGNGAHFEPRGGGGGGRGSRGQRGRGRGSGHSNNWQPSSQPVGNSKQRNTAMYAPSFSGVTSGGVAVHAGGNHAGSRLDTVGAIPNRYDVRR